jgi:hypothetical protein
VFKSTYRWERFSLHLSVAALFALSIAILELSLGRNLADDKPSRPPARDAGTPKEAKIERPPFDLTYVRPDAMGAIAIRPSAIFADPAMKPLARMADKGLAQLLKSLKLSADPKLSIESIQEIIGSIAIVPGDKKHGRDHSLAAGLTMIRVAHDFDWLKLMRQIDPKIEEVQQDGRVYYRSHFPKGFECISPKATFLFSMPDKRTVAFAQGKTSAHFSWDVDWKRVEHDLIAVALDNRWAHGLSKQELEAAPFPCCTDLVQYAATMVAGVDWKDGIDITAYLSSKDYVASDRIVKETKKLIAQFLTDLDQSPEPEEVPKDAREATAFQLKVYKELFEQVRVQQQGTTVRVHTRAKLKLADLAKYFFIGEPVSFK